jgi:hypothetical protein
MAQVGIDTAIAAGHVAPEVQTAASRLAPYAEQAGLEATGGLAGLNLVTDLYQGHSMAYAMAGSASSVVAATATGFASTWICGGPESGAGLFCGITGYVAGGAFGNQFGGEAGQYLWNQFG